MTLPTGAAVSFLFTDIEGSTRLERAIGSEAWAALVGRHDEILRGAIEGQNGVVVKTEGDAFSRPSRRRSTPCRLPSTDADSMTLLAGMYWRLGDPATSWVRLQEALGYFRETDNASGYARALGMAAIVLLADGDAELGARIAGATYRLVREKGVMLAPVKVLHLPDPAETATERFGADRAAALMAEGEAIPIDEVVAQVLAKPSPAPEPVST